jgi:hypothetical protein
MMPSHETALFARLVALQQRSVALLGDGTRIPHGLTGLIRECRGVGRMVRRMPQAALAEIERLERVYQRIASDLLQA